MLPISAYASNCTVEVAFTSGLKASESKYPLIFPTKKPYEINLSNINNYWVVSGFTSKDIRGGGAPEVLVNKDTCEAEKVYLAR